MPKLLIILFFFCFAWVGYGQCSNDTSSPLIFCPGDITVDNDLGQCYAIVNNDDDIKRLGFPAGVDNCGVVSTIANGIPANYEFPVGTTVITWTISDAAGNSDSCDQKITVIDAEGPQITCPSDITVNTDLGSCDAFVNVPIPAAIDNCGSSVVITNNYALSSGDADASGTYPLGSTIVTYTATDLGGAISTCELTVTVINNRKPTITLNDNSDITIEACDSYNELYATAEDSCFDNLELTNTISIDDSELDLSSPGTYSIRYNVTNPAGISADEVIRTVTVVDTTRPIVYLNGNDPQTINICGTYFDPGVIIDDGCVNNLTPVIISGDTVDTAVIGTYEVIYSFTDNAGNPAIYKDNNGNVITILKRQVEIIDIPGPEIVLLNNEEPQTIIACTSYIELGHTAIDPCTLQDFTNNSIIDSSELENNIDTPGSYTVTYIPYDDDGVAGFPEEREVIVVENTYVADAGSDFTTASCTETSVNLTALAPPALTIGTWTVTSGQTSGFSFSDSNDPNATFIGDAGQTYTLDWTVDFAEGCTDPSDQLTISIPGCNALDFDGTDDNVTFKDNFNFSGPFSIEIWVKPEVISANIQTILSKRETNDQTDGYDIRLVNNIVSFNWNNGESISTAPHQLNQDTWHHVAVTFDGSLYTLYADGIAFGSATGLVPTANTVDFILGAMEETINTPTEQDLHFNGGLDEFRVWNMALTVEQIRQMMNQELMDDGGVLKGKTTSIPIPGLSWGDLNGYYQMNQITDINSGKLTPSNSNPAEGILRFMDSFQDETAPLPYQSQGDGLWTEESSWLYGNARHIPNGFGIDGTTAIDWNIVTINHNIEVVDRDINLSSLIIETNTLSIANSDPEDGQYIRISHYLKLESANARLRLVGESQLLQDENSIADYSGLGQLERNQQGTANLFNYNYWSSPVSTNGTDFQIGTVLYDQDQNVQWTSSHDADGSTTPITLSRRWLYLYENYPEDNYASWNAIDENTSIAVGLGYLAKGSGTAETLQDYGFKGKPNNGPTQLPITSGNQALVGNPYPSAIDAHQFIDDNSSSIDGGLYFWVHYDTNSTHVLRDYQGGYAAYTKAGGNPAVSPPEISQDGSSSKIPERYIPVAQGFFVVSNSSGGDVTFNNGQRLFKKEAVTGASDNGSVFMRNAMASNPSAEQNEPIQRMRFNFYGTEGAKRPLLLAFTPDNAASESFDYGYDAINTGTLPSDASWLIEDKPYVIQGTAAFDDRQMYPLMVTASASGPVSFELSALENFENSVDIYVYDRVLQQTFQINDSNHEVYLESGQYTDRFAIVFKPNVSLSLNDEQSDFASVRYLINSKEIYIQLNPALSPTSATLFNSLGQPVKLWKANALQNANGTIRLNVNNLSEALYIFELKTSVQKLRTKLLFTKEQ